MGEVYRSHAGYVVIVHEEAITMLVVSPFLNEHYGRHPIPTFIVTIENKL